MPLLCMRRKRPARRTRPSGGPPRLGAALLLMLALQVSPGSLAAQAQAQAGRPRVLVLPFLAEAPGDRAVARSFYEALAGELRTREAIEHVAPGGERPGASAERRPRRGARPSEATFGQARRLMDQQKFAQAAAKLEESISLELAELEQASFSRVREARVLQAVCAFREGNEDQARRALLEVMRLWPAWSPPRGKYPPVFVRELERARERVRAGRRGKLVVKAPRGARVFLDGDDVGEAPVRLSEIPAGTHYVKVAHQGAVHAEAVEIARGAEATVSFTPPQAPEPAGPGHPRSERVLDEALARRLDVALGAARADAAVLGVVASGEGEGQIVVVAAIYARAQRLFGRFPPIALDAGLTMANVEAFKLADLITVAAQGFSRGVTLPFDLLEGVARPQALADVPAPAEERREEEAELAAADREADDAPRAPRLTPEATALDPRAAPLSPGQRERVKIDRTPPWVWWVAAGAGVAAVAGGTVFVVHEVRKPVSGTVTARW